jgi:hypothetical protein
LVGNRSAVLVGRARPRLGGSHPWRTRSSACRLTAAVNTGESSSHALGFTFRVHPVDSARLHRACTQRPRTRPPLGFGALRRFKHAAATYAGIPTPTVQHLQAFSTSWRVTPQHALPTLFHAGDAHGVPLFREFPSLPGPAAHRDENALLAFLLIVMIRQLLLANIIEEARACAFR